MSIGSERAALVALLRARPARMSWPEIMTEVVSAGSAVDIWLRYFPSLLMGVPGANDPVEDAESEIAEWEGDGLTLVTVLDAEYPQRLRGIHEAPPVLFTRGSLIPDDRSVSVVGSRKATDRGLDIADGVARGLVGEGVGVIAGLALGIDTAAHRAALDAGGRTVGVIATGIRKAYPAANRELHEEIAARGLLMSQFWPDAPPQKHTFLMRNATMSGYGLATVVVEAGETSGARAQARMAVGHGRPVVLTNLVVDKNEWAKAMVGRPGVYVASSLKEVLEIVRELLQNDPSRLVKETLSHLVLV